MVSVTEVPLYSRDAVFAVDGGMAGFQPEDLFDPSTHVTRFNGQVKEVLSLFHQGPFRVGGVTVGITIVLGTEGKAEEVPPQILEQVGKASLKFVRFPGCERVRRELRATGTEDDGSQHPCGLGDGEFDTVRFQLKGGCTVAGIHDCSAIR